MNGPIHPCRCMREAQGEWGIEHLWCGLRWIVYLRLVFVFGSCMIEFLWSSFSKVLLVGFVVAAYM
jgi:hypothetical protein